MKKRPEAKDLSDLGPDRRDIRVRRRGRSLVVPALMVLVLAACADLKRKPASDSPTASEPSPASTVATEPPKDSVAALPETPAEPTFDEDPNDLMGLNAAGLESLLGEPALLRREQPAQVWQYRAGDCVFDIVLYDDADGGRVNYIEARDKRGNSVATRPCYNAILKARARATSS